MLKSLFDDRKATHAAAYLLLLGGGAMSILKLMKLVYMAEKLSYARYGDPLTGDTPFSLKDGPILSAVYDRAKGNVPEGSIWPRFVNPRRGNVISIASPECRIEKLASLSDADIEVIDAIWRKFGKMTAWELRNYTHNFPEWEDPMRRNVRRLSIKPDRLLGSVGFGPQEAAERQKELERQARMQETLSSHN